MSVFARASMRVLGHLSSTQLVCAILWQHLWPLAPPYFSTLSHKRRDFRNKKKLQNIKWNLNFLNWFSKKFKHQVLSESFQWDPSCSIRTDGHEEVKSRFLRTRLLKITCPCEMTITGDILIHKVGRRPSGYWLYHYHHHQYRNHPSIIIIIL